MIRILHTLILFLALVLTANAQNTYTSTSLLNSGKWVKIRVKDEGVYQLTESSLKSMGFSNINKVRLYGYNLPVLPETDIQTLPDDLTEIPLYHSSVGTLLFYSKGTISWKRKNEYTAEYIHKNNPYSSYVYYFLTEDENIKPAEFRKIDGTTDATPTQTTYYAHSLHEKDEYSFINCGRTFFEAYDFASGSIRNYSLSLSGVPTEGKASVAVQFGAAGTSSSTLSVSHDKTKLGTLSMSRLTDYQYASVANNTLPITDLTDNKLSITLEHNRQSGTTGHLDYILASYETELEFINKVTAQLAFSPNTSGDKVFGIGCFDSSNLTVWNVTSPSSTYEITTTTIGENITLEDGATIQGKTIRFSVQNTKLNDLFVVLDQSVVYPAPEKVGEVKNQNLHALKDINLLIIVPSSGKLTAQAQRLAAEHEKVDGIKCAVVTANQVYNEFSSGTPDITAYRRLAKMLYDRDNSLQNILLFGACMWDNRFVTNGMKTYSQNDYLLVYESDNSWSHTDSYAAEEYIALLDNGEGVSPLKELPDAGIGRIPVTTEDDARKVVDKLISYINNREAGGWKNTICIMADDGNGNMHMEDADDVLKNTAMNFPDYRYKRIYWDSYQREQSSTGSGYPDALNEINRTMEEGALIMNYTGHGAAYCLSHEQVLKTHHFAEWSSPRLPLWFTAACDVCPFDMNTENLAVTALLNPKGAAMGFVSTARTVYSSPNRIINRNFMRHVLNTNDKGEHYTIGEALAMAKCDIISSKKNLSRLDSINKAQYVLMGDPAIRLITPKYKVKIDNISGTSIEEGISVLGAGSIVTVKGHIVDEKGNSADSYQGVIYPTVFDSEDVVTCYNNDKSADDNYVYREHRRTLYSGSDSIVGGKFGFTFTVPYDLNYSDNYGLMKLYAVNTSHTQEAHGYYTDFYIGTSGDIATTDTIGPRIKVWLDKPDFYNGMHTSTSPVLYAVLEDSTGINTTGNGIGHDIEAIIDGKETTTFSLNNYFKQTIGDYTSGTITYTIPTLSEGIHTLTLRAFDINNNPSTATITFVAVDGDETFEVFDTGGRRLNTSSTTVLPPGVYIRRSIIRKNGEIVREQAEKFLVTQ